MTEPTVQTDAFGAIVTPSDAPTVDPLRRARELAA